MSSVSLILGGFIRVRIKKCIHASHGDQPDNRAGFSGFCFVCALWRDDGAGRDHFAVVHRLHGIAAICAMPRGQRWPDRVMSAGTKKLADRDNEQEPDHQGSRARALPDHWPVHACTRIASQHFRLTLRAMNFQTDRKTCVLRKRVQAHSFREIESSAPTAGRERKERSFNRRFTLEWT